VTRQTGGLGRGHDLWAALGYGYLTAIVVVGGMSFGTAYLIPSPHGDPFNPPGRVELEDAFGNWDGKWYAQIARDGYTYDPKAMSSVAFFPAYPLLGRAVARVTGLPHTDALAVVSNLFLVAALCLLMDYARRRFPDGPPHLPVYSALALALCPLAFFFRVAYTESMFLFLAVLAMYGLLRRWPIFLVALTIGLATATRATGVALIPPLALAVWKEYPSFSRRVIVLAWAVPLSCWGLAAYAAYLGYEFGDPLAFSKAQDRWRFRPLVSWEEGALATVTFEPLTSAYDPVSPAYWKRFDRSLDPPFSLTWANPIYFLAAGFLVAIGAWRKWLTPGEVFLAGGLVAIPYVSRGYYACMLAHGRYAAAAFPIYLVLGHLLARLPAPVVVMLLTLSGCLMAAYVALFAGRYFII
jgi:hypothetical protein